MATKRVLITGGAGFIGGHIAEGLAAGGHDVTVLDNFEPYYDLGIKEHNVDAAKQAAEENGGTYELVKASITDAEKVADLVADVDALYHQAAQAGVRKSVEEPAKVNSYNVDGTINVLEAARKHDIERAVIASSSSVYGKPEYLPYDEEHPTTPVSPYGVSKLATEQYARVYNEIYGLPTVALRYFTVYGPRMRPNMAFTNFVSRCLHGEPPVIYGDGSQTRDFTYKDDIVRVNEQLLEDDSADGEIMNIGSTDNIDILTLAEIIRDEIDSSLEIEFDEARTGDAEHTHADISKANELLGYEPTIDIREGTRTFIDWYRDNEAWYDPLVRNS
ncbi:SDR family NAD(P)-dependent oxidoreductase [Natronomonas salina]|uniref:SDR family NAD(P)-dependent oxidoreductase n=1 Tax=Natronomonas salina TaxID=1710540 RepID=UPI0015B6DB65|nr:SDR family NAD(P)-dependent oxidoreductase [Natronomonas salina]QLD88788.1 SDR family NAD(P)-dependent oxidoreductase [Natronomonas salina]